MRVAMLLLEYLPILGGAQRQLAALAPLLHQRGVEVQVLTRRAPGLPRREDVRGVPVHRLPAPGPRPAASLAFTAAALARLEAMRPDVVHAYSLFSPATIAVLAKRRLGVATVVKVLRGGRAGDVERLVAKPFSSVRVRRLRRDIDAFVTISDEIDAELAGLGVSRERRRRIPNGVDTERFQPVSPQERRERRRALSLPETPTVVYCGRLVAEKRVNGLLEAWRRLRSERSQGSLLVVGSGPEADALRRLPAEGVHWVGAADDVLPYLQAADAFVLPSATEGLSNAMLEAMAVGLPVVATKVGAAAEVVSDPATGTLVRPDDVRELGAALESVLFGPGGVEQGRRGRARVVDGFALPSVADRLAALYAELLSQGSGGGVRGVRP